MGNSNLKAILREELKRSKNFNFFPSKDLKINSPKCLPYII